MGRVGVDGLEGVKGGMRRSEEGELWLEDKMKFKNKLINLKREYSCVSGEERFDILEWNDKIC